MSAWWPWLAVAGAGAMHGLMPTSGWGLAVACRLHARGARAALGPIACGHVLSMAVAAAALASGLPADALPGLAVAVPVTLGLVLATWRALNARRLLALASFAATTVQGAGMMLVPALVPLCLGASPAREITASGSLALALAAAGVHTAAMLATTAACTGAARLAARALRARASPTAAPASPAPACARRSSR